METIDQVRELLLARLAEINAESASIGGVLDSLAKPEIPTRRRRTKKKKAGRRPIEKLEMRPIEETLAHYRKHGSPPPQAFEDGDFGPMTRPIAGLEF